MTQIEGSIDITGPDEHSQAEWHMDIRWLQDFLAVAETGSFTRAAQLRNVSQAAFSRRIKGLEAWLGTALIDRTSFPSSLTPDGESFRERAAEIVQQIADARLGGATPSRRTQFRIALPHSLATGRFPSWWNAWSKEIGRGVTCSILTGDVSDTVAALMTADVDLLICYQSAHLPITLPADQYDHISIGQEILAPYAATPLIASLRDVFPGRKGSPIPLLAYTKSSTFAQVLDGIFETAPQKLTAKTVFETESTTVLRAMVAAGHGLAWLPQCVASEAHPGALQRIDAHGWSASLKIVAYRNKQAVFPALARLWALFSMAHPSGEAANRPPKGP